MYNYDIVKLETLCGINVKSAIAQFDTPRGYFGELDDFVNTSKHYLTNCDACKIIYEDKARREFFKETQQIKRIFSKLKLDELKLTLEDLEKCATGDNINDLLNLLDDFQHKVDIMAKSIVSSRLSGIQQSEGKPLILAVDDKPELLAATIGVLEDRFRVMAVTNGKQALKVIEKHIPELFLLDIEMPVMNGYELAEQIRLRQKFKQTPIIFLTSINTRTSVIEAVKNGGNDYILKPIDKNLLLSKILQHLGKI